MQAGAKLPLHRLLDTSSGTWRHWPLTPELDAADESDVAEGSESSSDGEEEDGDEEDDDDDDDEDDDNDGDLHGFRRQNGSAARSSDDKEDEVHSLCPLMQYLRCADLC